MVVVSTTALGAGRFASTMFRDVSVVVALVAACGRGIILLGTEFEISNCDLCRCFVNGKT